MPQITNTTSADIWLPQLGITVPALSYVNSDVYPVQGPNSGISTDPTWIPAGLSINYAVDALDPLLLSQTCSQNTTIQLPTSILPRTSYKVKIWCSSGPIGVRFNTTSNTLFSIATTDYFEIACQSRTIDTIYIYINTLGYGAGTCYVTVRKA